MGWLQTHLEEFVKPVLGYVPELSKDHKPFFSPQERVVVKNMWRSVKAEARRLNKPILLAGRDVFIFEILARREGYPTVFRPEISRLTADYIKEDYSNHFLFDTGFAGSIPRALRCASFQMASSNQVGLGKVLGSPRRWTHQLNTTETHQIFPRMKGARSLVLKIEYTPKYWKRGFHREPACMCEEPCKPERNWMPTCIRCYKEIREDKREGIQQELSDADEFLKAALLTIEIYKDSSPRFNAESLGPIVRDGLHNYFGE